MTTNSVPPGNGRVVLVVGSGGREHAIAEAVSRSPRVSRLLVTPGNGGTPGERFRIASDDIQGIVDLAVREGVDIAIIGPEVALEAGVVDALQLAGVQAFGPTADLARIEASKSHARSLATRL
ncbi:MAG: phosphoribosylamine--glycine ligase, partial [Chloroflexota bacterium]